MTKAKTCNKVFTKTASVIFTDSYPTILQTSNYAGRECLGGGSRERKNNMSSKHNETTDIKKIEHFLNPFGWTGGNTSGVIKSPSDLNYKSLEQSCKASVGHFTLNPETMHTDWAEAFKQDKVKVKEFSEFRGKPLSELATYLAKEEQAGRIKLPDLTLSQFICEHSDQIPKKTLDQLKKGWHYQFGSVIYDSGNNWRVPWVHKMMNKLKKEEEFICYGSPLDRLFDFHDFILTLE